MNQNLSRRSALGKITGGAVVAAATSFTRRLEAAEAAASPKGMGLQSVELVEVKDFPTLKKYDLTCAMVTGVPGGITSGWNRVENHDKIVAFFEETMPTAA